MITAGQARDLSDSVAMRAAHVEMVIAVMDAAIRKLAAMGEFEATFVINQIEGLQMPLIRSAVEESLRWHGYKVDKGADSSCGDFLVVSWDKTERSAE